MMKESPGDMKTRGNETLEHTADMGVRGWGADIETALEEAASAMLGIIAERSGLESSLSIEIACKAESLEDLLVEFLNALLTELDLEEAVGISVDISGIFRMGDEYRLAATASCAARKEAAGSLLQEVKAATSYGARVEPIQGERWEAICVVDI